MTVERQFRGWSEVRGVRLRRIIANEAEQSPVHVSERARTARMKPKNEYLSLWKSGERGELYGRATSEPKTNAKKTPRVGNHGRIGSAPEMMLPVPIEAEGSGASTDATDKAVSDKLANPTEAGSYRKTE